jgi:hypothetical protein
LKSPENADEGSILLPAFVRRIPMAERSQTVPRISAPILHLDQNGKYPMRFETVNEKGVVEKLSDNGRHRLSYASDFYGSCSFTAKILLGEQNSFLLCENSIVLEEYQLRRGDLSALLNVSVTFFKKMFSSYRA